MQEQQRQVEGGQRQAIQFQRSQGYQGGEKRRRASRQPNAVEECSEASSL